MEDTLRGGGGSTTGSVSTVSKEDNLVMSSEVSSSYPDESEIELGLGLSLGFGGGSVGGAAAAMANKSKTAPWGQYARILTAKDFLSVVSKASSSSSSSSATRNNNTSCGTKRSAESFSPPRSGVSQVVGWPPVRASRMNSLVNLAKSAASEDCNSTAEKGKNRSAVLEKIDGGRSRNNSKAKGFTKNSLFVKVNMDGIPIGRKVDLSVHTCYETLAQTLDDMFCGSSTNMSSRTSYMEEHVGRTDATGSLQLLDGSSDFVLTYEDKEGDWMLVGDVPWEMFISSVKRLRIMRTSEANGLAPRTEGRSERERIKPI